MCACLNCDQHCSEIPVLYPTSDLPYFTTQKLQWMETFLFRQTGKQNLLVTWGT